MKQQNHFEQSTSLHMLDVMLTKTCITTNILTLQLLRLISCLS